MECVNNIESLLQENGPIFKDEPSGAMAALKIDDANIEILAEQNREILVQDMGFPITDVKTALFELAHQGKCCLNAVMVLF